MGRYEIHFAYKHATQDSQASEYQYVVMHKIIDGINSTATLCGPISSLSSSHFLKSSTPVSKIMV